jgi:hypothetical protein
MAPGRESCDVRFCWQAGLLYAKKQCPGALGAGEQVKIYSISSIKKVGNYVRIVGKG